MKTETINIWTEPITITLWGTFLQLQNLWDTEIYFNIWDQIVSVWNWFCLPSKFSSFNVDKELIIWKITLISNWGTWKITYLSQ